MDEPRRTTRRTWLRRAVTAGAGAAAGAILSGTAKASCEPSGAPTLFDVRCHGAVGDGVTDDSTAAQAAIDAAVVAGNGRVHFPSGRYRITRTLKVSSAARIAITGDGWSSILLHEEDAPLLLWEAGVSCRECSVRHLAIVTTVRDKSAGVAAIACLGGVERSHFGHLLFSAAPPYRMGSGIITDTVADTTTFENCLVWGPIRGTGLKIARGSEVRVIGGRIIGQHGKDAALIPGSIGIHVVSDNGGVHVVTTDLIGLGTAMKIGEAGRTANREIFITHATLDSCIHGLHQVDSAYTSIAGCWSASSDEEQILLDTGAAGAIMSISGGTIFNGGVYGRAGNGNGLVIRAGSVMLTGVTVRHNKGTGILMGSSARDCAVTGCRIVANGTGAYLAGTNLTFTGNVLSDNGRALVMQPRSDRIVLGNASSGAALSPPPGDVAPVGPTGLFTGANGGGYGDGRVDLRDAEAALRIAAGLDPLP